ncbi:unnamed protein product [Prorocentrum cordatum]|uniref:Clathrin light chain n=1 Tax=Prorocentrum cordatum TaxID=2364126 RepID=A0ABN9TKM2_9DINO|nr:unnamed protein product [Polarella glacialis]
MSELRRTAGCPEESVAADQYQVWSAQLAAQQAEVERWRARSLELEQALADAQASAAVVARERDEWRARAQRHEMNKEFRSVVDGTGGGRPQTADEQEWQRRLRASEAPSWFALEEAPQCPQQPPLLRPTCRGSAPDFGRALRLQLGLVEGQRQATGD